MFLCEEANVTFNRRGVASGHSLIPSQLPLCMMASSTFAYLQSTVFGRIATNNFPLHWETPWPLNTSPKLLKY